MSSLRGDNARSRSSQSLQLSPLHLKQISTSPNSLDVPKSPQKYHQHSPRPQDSNSFSYTNPQEEQSNNNIASQDNTYVPPSPLQLWKIGQTDVSDDNDCAKKNTNNRSFSEASSINSVQCNLNNSKDKVSTTNHSSSSYTTITSTSQPTPGNSITSSGTAKKRGQVR